MTNRFYRKASGAEVNHRAIVQPQEHGGVDTKMINIQRNCQADAAHRRFRTWGRMSSLMLVLMLGLLVAVLSEATSGQVGPPALVSPFVSHIPNIATLQGLNDQGPTFENPRKIHWRFGLKIESTGNARGITATFPVPLDWPEQEIILETKLHSSNVDKLRFSQPTKESRMVTFQINQLRPGEVAEAYLLLELSKSLIVAPKKRDSLRIPAGIGPGLKPFLGSSPFIETKDRRIVEIANRLKDQQLTGWEQVQVIYHWVREQIEYQFDEEIRSCLDALDTGKGDCEEMSSLFIAICRAMQIPARAVWIPDHTYPEFYLEDEQGLGYWFPCQVAGDEHFGAMPELRPIIHKGDRFRVAGKREMVRYLEPTLLERSGMGALQVQWVAEPVEDQSKIDNGP
jgi:hypothetical protein